MHTWWRSAAGAALWLVAITVVVWSLTLWRWDAQQRQVSNADIGVYLFALPLIAWALLLTLRWVWRSSGARTAAAIATTVPVQAAPPPAATGPDQREWSFAVLWEGLRCSAGDDAPAVGAAVLAGHRPALDPRQADPDGMRMLTGRVKDVDAAAAAAAETLSLLAQGHAAAAVHIDADHSMARVVALLQPVLAAALQLLDDWLPPAAVVPPSPAAEPAVADLVLWCAVPIVWSDAQRTLVRHWLQQQCSTARPDLVNRFDIQCQAVDGGEVLLLQADRQLAAWQAQGKPRALLLLSADSCIDEPFIQRFHARGELLSGDRAQGWVPGESAAGVWLCTLDWAPSDAVLDGKPAWPRLHRLALVRRGKAADAAGAVSSAELEMALEAAATGAQLDLTALAGVVADADMRPRTGRELRGALMARCPHLDAAEQVWALGAACGDTGVSRPLLQLALAAGLCRQGLQAVATLTTTPVHDRLAMIVKAPVPETPPAPAAAT